MERPQLGVAAQAGTGDSNPHGTSALAALVVTPAGISSGSGSLEIIKTIIMIKANINKHLLCMPGILLNESQTLYHHLKFSDYENVHTENWRV